MKPRVPFGFYFCGLCSAAFALFLAVILLFEDGTALNHAGVGLLSALALVNAEALWRARHWAWRASVALAASYVAVVIIGFAVEGEIETAFPVLLGSAVVVAPQLAYIHDRMKQLWPRPGQMPVRTPAPSSYPTAYAAPGHGVAMQPGRNP